MAPLLTPSIALRHLRYFVAAAEHGGLRKAGVALEVKESSISRSVRDLEAALFHRRGSSPRGGDM